MKKSKAFEQQIHRIHELLDGSGAEVVWNDHIPDPDNPSQPRQIDITIRRDGKLTHVECRQHHTRQDVQWIEELIGRRTSLGADSIIAVSSSGFTSGSLKKASRHGIVTRDLRELTDLEIKSWGGRVALTLYFYEYSDLEISLCFDHTSIPRLNADVVRSELALCSVVQSFFKAAAKKLTALNLISGEYVGQSIKFNLRIERPDFKLSSESVLEVNFRGKGRLISRDVISTAISAYGEPDDSSALREAIVETFPLGETSIVHEGSRISVLLDVSQVKVPAFCQFQFFKLTGGEEIIDFEMLEIVGLDKLWVHGKMNIDICSR